MAIKVMLCEDVSSLGKMGDVVSVSDGYARNYLLPRKLAVAPSAENLRAIEAEKKRRTARELERLSDLKAMADRISAIDVTLKERVAGDDKLYGAVSAREIAAALAEEDIHIDADMILMEEPIKTLGVHRVPIRLHADVTAELKVWVVELKDSEAKVGE